MAQFTVRLDDDLADKITRERPHTAVNSSSRNKFLVELLELGLFTYQENLFEEAKKGSADAGA